MKPRSNRALTAVLAMAMVATLPGVTAAQQASAAPVLEAQPTLTDAVDASITSLAIELGRDPAAIRSWVADNVAAAQYDGILKGARGTFLTRTANTTDQALLVAALISGAGSTTPVRFATCELAGGSAPPDSAAPFDSALDHADEIVAEVTDPELASAVLALRDYRIRTKERTATAAQELEIALGSMADQKPAPLPSAESMTEHVWLQVEQGGTWVDQDPSTADGAAPCLAASTFDALPDALFHRVRFSLTLERQVAGALETSTALEAESSIAALAAARIAFGFAEPIGLIARDPDDEAAELAYTPVLHVDNTSVTGTPILLPRIVADGGVGGFDAFGGFDGGLGGDDPSASEVDPVTAAWLDIELITPDGQVTTLRSDVFDRIGVVARSDGTAASAAVEPLVQVNGEYAALDTMWQIGLLLGEMRAPDAVVAPFLDTVTVDGLSGTIDALLRLFPAMRHDLGGATSIPVVLLAGMGPVAGPAKRGGLEPGEVVMQLVLDAIHVPADAPVDRADAARDAQAVLAAEQMLVAVSGGTIDPLGDAGSVFQSAAKTATPVVTLVPGDTPQITGATPQALARMTARLEDGYTLLTPATAPSIYSTSRTAWWFVDPVTGVVRDEHESGRHQGETEYGGTTSTVSTRYQQICTFAIRMRAPIAIAAFMLAAATGFDPKTGGAIFKGVAKVGSALYERKKTADQALKLACPGDAPPGPPLP